MVKNEPKTWESANTALTQRNRAKGLSVAHLWGVILAVGLTFPKVVLKRAPSLATPPTEGCEAQARRRRHRLEALLYKKVGAHWSPNGPHLCFSGSHWGPNAPQMDPGAKNQPFLK